MYVREGAGMRMPHAGAASESCIPACILVLSMYIERCTRVIAISASSLGEAPGLKYCITAFEQLVSKFGLEGKVAKER